MMLRFRYLLCVAAITGFCSFAGTSQAATITYDANEDFYASESGATPSTSFGTWSIGYRTAAAGVTGTSLTAFNTLGYGSEGYFHQWYIGGSTYSIPMTTINMADNYRFPLSSKEIGMGPSMTNGWGTDAALLNNSYNVLRWTAPEDGIVNVTTDLSNNGGNAVADVHLVVGGAAAWDTVINASVPVDQSVSGIAVAAGQYVDLVVGNNGVNPPNAVGVYQTIDFTAVPEPSGCVLLMVAMSAILAYAWRRRR